MSRVDLGTRGEGNGVRGASAEGNGAEGNALGPTGSVMSDEPTPGVHFPARKNSQDYHEKMDCNVFMWCQNRNVLLTELTFHGEDKMKLILDRAAYPHGMEDKWKWLLKIKKREGEALLSARRIGAVNMDCNWESMPFKAPCDDDEFLNGPRGLQSMRSRRKLSKEKKHPEDILTGAERCFKQIDAGYMLFKPPDRPRTLSPSSSSGKMRKTMLHLDTKDLEACRIRRCPSVEDDIKDRPHSA